MARVLLMVHKLRWTIITLPTFASLVTLRLDRMHSVVLRLSLLLLSIAGTS